MKMQAGCDLFSGLWLAIVETPNKSNIAFRVHTQNSNFISVELMNSSIVIELSHLITS